MLSHNADCTLSQSQRFEVIPVLLNFQSNPKESSGKSSLACAVARQTHDIYFMLMPIIEGESVTLTLHSSYIAGEDILHDALLLNPTVLCDDVSDVMAPSVRRVDPPACAATKYFHF